MKKGIIVVVLFLIGFLSAPVSSLVLKTNITLPSKIESGARVDFVLEISDIQGQCIYIETDLDQDKGRDIFNLTGIEYSFIKKGPKGKSILICGNFRGKSLKIPIHGIVPSGVIIQKVSIKARNETKVLVLKSFDTSDHYYYLVKDLSTKDGPEIDKDFTPFKIKNPEYDQLINEINSLNATDAKQIALKMLDYGLFDIVKNDLMPIFKNYDPTTAKKLSECEKALNLSQKELQETQSKAQKNLFVGIGIGVIIGVFIGYIIGHNRGYKKGWDECNKRKTKIKKK
ncbi:hypothetical protein [Pyrococcus abyssi]|uniref:Transmembrane protein n=1 Tax=Pyrococcus abyssi (strain GE5 / Orsay) TaxID=272844 RepID=G8ZK12_PYRAB|nr:hypothetical protein [Pyrococcus abyssi]CCE71119.1 TPA: hypothetical protein PAB1256 [Pyrococcus abyssi GE5]